MSAPAQKPETPSAAPRNTRSQSIREKLSPDRIEQMRELVEGGTRSYKRIAEELGVATATVSRYAADGGWKRPPGAPLPARITDQRERVTQKLWALTERHAEAMEALPFDLAQRSLQPLARLTRTLTDMEKLAARPEPQENRKNSRSSSRQSSREDDFSRNFVGIYDQPEDAPPRSLHELRDELDAHLQRIMREEGYGWEVREWWFESGGGI